MDRNRRRVQAGHAVAVEAALIAELQHYGLHTGSQQRLGKRLRFPKADPRWRPVQENARLGFVGCEQIDVGQQLGIEPLRGSRIEDRLGALLAGNGQGTHDGLGRRLQLK